jgi:hypothetical protein
MFSMQTSPWWKFVRAVPLGIVACESSEREPAGSTVDPEISSSTDTIVGHVPFGSVTLPALAD